jgi:thymidylate synthase ThyX
MWEGRIPHRSTGYHPHMTFFIANVSRRVSHELIRNYVGHARDEEGAPSQESTRYTDHPGVYIAHPKIVENPEELRLFTEAMQRGYDEYLAYQQREIEAFRAAHGALPKGMDRKRIYESASSYLHHSCATSFIWTSNPMALCKLCEERVDYAADLEMQRFVRVWRDACLAHEPNLYVTLSANARS